MLQDEDGGAASPERASLCPNSLQIAEQELAEFVVAVTSHEHMISPLTAVHRSKGNH
jgi:hypothetical protein